MAVIKKGASLPAITAPLDMPEWGGQVLIRAMTVADMRAFEKQSAEDPLTGAAFAIQRCVVDDEGKHLFDDIAAVEALDMTIVRRLSEAITDLVTPPKPETIAKNSEASLN